MFYVVSHTHHGMPRTAYGRADSRPSIQRTNERTDGWALDQENFVQPPLKLGVRYLLCQSLTPNILLSLSQSVIRTSMKSWFFRLIIPKVSTPHSRCQISQILTGQSWIDWTWSSRCVYGMRAEWVYWVEKNFRNLVYKQLHRERGVQSRITRRW